LRYLCILFCLLSLKCFGQADSSTRKIKYEAEASATTNFLPDRKAVDFLEIKSVGYGFSLSWNFLPTPHLEFGALWSSMFFYQPDKQIKDSLNSTSYWGYEFDLLHFSQIMATVSFIQQWRSWKFKESPGIGLNLYFAPYAMYHKSQQIPGLYRTAGMYGNIHLALMVSAEAQYRLNKHWSVFLNGALLSDVPLSNNYSTFYILMFDQTYIYFKSLYFLQTGLGISYRIND
jgi:hypothetical protein